MRFSNAQLVNIFCDARPDYILERIVFNNAGAYCEDYNGGNWSIARCGEFVYVVPPTGTYTVTNPNNYYRGTMDQNSYGAALTLLIINKLIWDAHESAKMDLCQRLTEMFYSLRDAVYNDSNLNGGEIAAFLD